MTALATVVAFDPGETTGWCVMSVEKWALDMIIVEKVPLEKSLVHIAYGQILCLDENDGVSRMLDVWAQSPLACVVHEDFIIDFHKIDQARHTLSPVRITAKFEFGAYLQGLNEEQIFIQNRSPVKTTCTDERLKNWGLYDRHSGKHARDATRHAYYFLRTCRGNSLAAEEARWKAWPWLFPDPLPEHTKHGTFRMRKRPEGERIPGLG
jgi:hypothetical protein